jgi:hypothetical protein
MFITLTFDRTGWKRVIEDLAINQEMSRLLQQEPMAVRALSGAIQDVASWPATERRRLAREGQSEYSAKDATVRLDGGGLLVFSIWTWMSIVTDAHDVWGAPGLPHWQAPIICKW